MYKDSDKKHNVNTCIKKSVCFFNMAETRSWLKTIEVDVKQELSHDCVFSKRKTKLLLE